MRQALFSAQPGRGLAGLVHGSTLSALARKGLVKSTGYNEGLLRLDYALSEGGLAVRNMLRERALRLVAKHGYRQQDTSSGTLLLATPDGKTTTLGSAMRFTGVKP